MDTPSKIAIIGGGYAGLAALIKLRRQSADTHLTLIEPNTHHLKLTHLHETLSKPLNNFRVSYAELAAQFDFTHIQAAATINETTLQDWQQTQRIECQNDVVDFDILIIAIGAKSFDLPTGDAVYTQEDFYHRSGREILQAHAPETGDYHIHVIGGGATGIQFLFELKDRLKRHGQAARLALVDMAPRTLEGLPRRAHSYTKICLREANIEYLPMTCYLGQAAGQIQLENLRDGVQYQQPSDLTLLFPGVIGAPPLRTNRRGQVRAAGQTLERIYVAGDCAEFEGIGLNSLTAQAAVRKGKFVADNISRTFAGRRQRNYTYQTRGYFVSLGRNKGVGWAGSPLNLVTGLPAFAIKELIEVQYDLFENGIDTYF